LFQLATGVSLLFHIAKHLKGEEVGLTEVIWMTCYLA